MFIHSHHYPLFLSVAFSHTPCTSLSGFHIHISTGYMKHIFFCCIYESTLIHIFWWTSALGPFLAIENSAAMKKVVKVSLWCADTYQSMVEWGHMGFCFQSFEEPLYCYPLWLHMFILPTAVRKGSSFLYPHLEVVICFLTSRLEWDGVSGLFVFTFPWWIRILNTFPSISQLFVFLLMRTVSLTYILKGCVWGGGR